MRPEHVKARNIRYSITHADFRIRTNIFVFTSNQPRHDSNQFKRKITSKNFEQMVSATRERIGAAFHNLTHGSPSDLLTYSSQLHSVLALFYLQGAGNAIRILQTARKIDINDWSQNEYFTCEDAKTICDPK
jgi:hypothetical protein